MRKRIGNANERIKTILLLLIGHVDRGILDKYIGSSLQDGFTTYNYDELIKYGHEALDFWETKINETEEIRYTKKEAMKYLGLKTINQLSWYISSYSIKNTKGKNGKNLYLKSDIMRLSNKIRTPK